MDALDKQRWIALSPLLDELLDLEEPARARRLAEIRSGDVAMAEHLEALLAQDALLNQDPDRFLEQPAAEVLQGPLPAPPLTPDLSGETLGPYLLERELGQGGMGAVWLARRADGRFEGEVAVKFLKSGLFGKGDGGRFEREGQILARLSHPNIARLLDAGLHQGHQPYLVLEFVDGLPIDRYCQVNGLEIEARVQLFLDVLAAVAHAHQRLILHRDLKPSNILVTHDGQVKLLDFGIAKLLDDATQSGAATELTQRAGSAFTPQYAAPEQVQQADVTTATDVYALGVLLYQLLGGRHPTAEDTQTHLDRLRAVVDLVPKRLSDVAAYQLDPAIARHAKLLRGDLDTIVAKALKKTPSARYANAELMAVDLRHWLAHEPIAARPDSRLYVMSRFVRRHRWSVAAGTAAVLALLSLTTVSVVQARRAERAEHQAQERRQQADDLLSYMLGEFADKLRPVGRLELLDSVGSKALTYLAQDDQASPQERLQRAKALTVIGEVRVSKRNLKEALEPLEAARRLLDGEPPSKALTGEWLKARGAASFWTGHVHYYTRDLALANTAWEDYRNAEQAWVAAEPDNVTALFELAYAYNSLGTARMEMADLRAANEFFRQSIALKKRAMAASTEVGTSSRMDLADSMSWLGTVLLWQGLDQAAARTYEEAATLIADARREAPQDGWAYREAIMRRWSAEALMNLGKRPQAIQDASSASTILETLAAKDPSNLQWQINRLRMQLLDLEARGATLPLPVRRERLAAVRASLDGLSKGKIDTRLADAWLKWAALHARAAWDAGATADGRATLAHAVDQVRPMLDSRPSDVRILTTYVLARQVQMDLLKTLPDADSASERQLVCRDVVDRIMKIDGLLRVHQLISRTWVDAQSCLGQGGREDVKRTANWLERDRSGDSPT